MNLRVGLSVVALGVALSASAALTVAKFSGTVYAPGQVEVTCNAASADRLLWCAWGDRDYGETFAAWPHNESLGTVAAGATQATYTLPEPSQSAQCARLFFFDGRLSAPLGYLRADGTQCIDTGYRPNAGTAATIDFMPTKTHWNQQRPFGSETSDAGYLTFSTYMNGFDYNGASCWAWGCRNGTGNWRGTIIRVELIPHRTQITLDNFGGIFQIVNSWTNFTEALDVAVTAANRTGTALFPLAIFAARSGETTYVNKLTGFFYELAVSESNTLVRTYRPYLNAGVAGARETVNGTFHGNAGTGAFYAGGLAGAAALEASAAIDLANLRTTDVFADVDFWMRGMAVDANGNKILDNNELVDSLNRRTFATTVFAPEGHRPVISNEFVRLPGRNVERRMQTLWFPQDRVFGDSARTNGTLYPCSVRLPRFIDYTNHWSCVLRFRPDFGRTKIQTTSEWLLNLGHTGKMGLLFGLSGGDGKSWKYVSLYTGSKGLSPMYYNNGKDDWNESKSRRGCNVQMMVTNGWTDVGLSADGQKLTVIVMRDGAKLSDMDGLLQKNTYTISSEVSLAPDPTADVLLGTESLSSRPLPHPAVNPSAANNEYKLFQGSLQQFAMWKRSMNEAELLMAMGYPRQDVWRVGVEDGEVKEFSGDEPEGGLAVDGESWPVPQAIASGARVTLNFPLAANWDDRASQIVRLKAAETSADGLFGATLNGVGLGSKVVRAGNWGRWFVDASLLRAGTNTLVFTRLDAGTAPFRMDVAAMGGGWQVGLLDNGYRDFAHETYGQINYYVSDGNMRDVRRVLLGARYPSNAMRFHSYMPRELARRYDWTFRFRTKGQIYGHSRLAIDLNGVNVFDRIVKVDTDYEIPIASADLPSGENIISLRNLDTLTHAGTNADPQRYIGFDYFQLDPSRPAAGSLMILR